MAMPSPSWSCDSFVVMPDATVGGRLLFGKNSDRPARECQPLRRVRARSGGGRLELAYLEIPDADQTYDHIASSPYWCWGHEIGMNSEGVVIGNEALFTRDLAATAAADRRAVAEGTVRPRLGLLGMELLRLGLERGGSAAEAVEVITGLLERFGQWGVPGLSVDIFVEADAGPNNTWWSTSATNNPSERGGDQLALDIWCAAHDVTPLPNVDVWLGGRGN